MLSTELSFFFLFSFSFSCCGSFGKSEARTRHGGPNSSTGTEIETDYTEIPPKGGWSCQRLGEGSQWTDNKTRRKISTAAAF